MFCVPWHGKGSAVNYYTVKMGFELPEGTTEDQFWRKFYGSTKHSGLGWCIEGEFEDHGPVEAEENDCE